MNRNEALKATRNGAIAACISGAVTLVITTLSLADVTTDMHKLWNDPLNYIDVILIFACAYGIYKKSRTAAVFLFILFILGKIYYALETGSISELTVGIVFLYFFGKAIQGAFTFHNIERLENPNYKLTPRWVYYTSLPVIVVFLILFGFSLLTMTDVMPSMEVQSRTEFFPKDKDTLVSNGIISESDTVEFFYSDGLFSILESGAILTSDRVIQYFPDDNQEMLIFEVYLNDVASIELIEKGDSLQDTIYRIHSKKPDMYVDLYLSVENGGDKRFMKALRTMTSGNNQ